MELNAPHGSRVFCLGAVHCCSFKKGKNSQALTTASNKQNSSFLAPYLVVLL